ncbi:MAG TPA: plastocyanin/azurin family copper-binding protein [Acidimicrobiales bacterium]|jgi:plastocyanin|nr:plastocyanin/azurin family copper-binding protein [Acidimicrobiales bacterium]
MGPVAKMFRLLISTLALGLLTSACAYGYNVPAGMKVQANPPHPPHATVAVVLHHFSFGPAKVTIRAGQTIEWIWQDPGVPHNVTFAHFHSETKTAGTYYHTFTTPGVYHYECTVHADTMRGVVVVRS